MDGSVDLPGTAARLLRQVSQLGTLCPELWRRIDAVREREEWPPWCFVPTQTLCRLLAEERGISPKAGAKVNAIAALAGWRVTQGIYSFDPDLFDCVWNTPLDDRIPGEVLLRMPEWSVYIPTPGRAFGGYSLHGFFAHLDFEIGRGRRELRLLLDLGAAGLLSALPIEIGNGSLLRGLAASRDWLLSTLTGAGDESDLDRLRATDLQQYAGMLGSLVNLVLYVCSANAEVRDKASRTPAQPPAKRTRGSRRHFPPDKPTEWLVGYRLGAALRAAAARAVERTEPNGRRAAPRPHIRRAHWHSYWLGSHFPGGQRRLSLKWMPPVTVNFSAGEQAIPVVRTVSSVFQS